MPHPTAAVIVRHPEAQAMVVLNPAEDYPADDVLVRAFPWAFTPRDIKPGIVESVAIEQASAAPGEKRSRRSAL